MIVQSKKKTSVLDTNMNKLLKKLIQEPIQRRNDYSNRKIASNKHIKLQQKILIQQCLPPRLSTDQKNQEPSQSQISFVFQFNQLIKDEKIKIRDGKENRQINKQPRSAQQHVKSASLLLRQESHLDIIDLVRMKPNKNKYHINSHMDSFYDKQYMNLQYLIARNKKALDIFVKNREELINLSVAKQLRKL